MEVVQRQTSRKKVSTKNAEPAGSLQCCKSSDGRIYKQGANRIYIAIVMYKIVNNLVKIPVDQYLTTAAVSTRGHQQRFLVPFCSINAYKGSFCQQRPFSKIPCQQAPFQQHHWRTSRSMSVLIYQDCS